MRRTTYIAGPVTAGDRIHNFNQACIAQRELMAAGFAPLNPMLSMLHPAAWQIPHEDWMESDLPWVAVADCVLRLPGESVGADREVEFARERGIPVFYAIEQISEHFAPPHQPVEQPPSLNLIAFTGYAGAGKDSAAEALIKEGWQRVAFADPVREMALVIDPWVCRDDNRTTVIRLSRLVEDYDWTEAKKHSEVRRLLQRIGTEAGRNIIGKNVWIDIAMRKVAAIHAAGGKVVITDLRFPNEADAVRQLGGKIVRINRPGVGPAGDHSSENVGLIDADATISNSGDQAKLHASVWDTMIHFEPAYAPL